MSQPPTAPPPRPSREVNIDAQAIEMHAPHLYAHDAVAQPLDGFDAVTDRHVEVYRSQGFLAIDHAFTPRATADALQGVSDLISGRHPDFKNIQLEAKADGDLEALTSEQQQDATRKLMGFISYEGRLRAMAEHPQLLALIRRLMGGKEPRLFQDMLLLKPPHIGREKPWHQDCAYFNLSLGTAVVGVWIALDEATIENGCMRLLAGAHREGPIPHWNRRDWQICDTDLDGKRAPERPVVAAPLKPGGLLLFDGLLPHGTPHNNSGQRRRAVQYHYRPADAAKTTPEERMRIFGTEGKHVSC